MTASGTERATPRPERRLSGRRSDGVAADWANWVGVRATGLRARAHVHGPILHLANVPFNTIWQRPHQIAAGLCEYADVVYADPNCSFLQFLRPGHRLRLPDHLPPRLSVFTPPPGLPLARQFGLAHRLNYAVVGRRLRTFLRAEGLRPAVVVATFPDHYDLLEHFPDVPLVYDLMDEPYLFVRQSRRARSVRLHQQMLARTDILVTSAQGLAERYAGAVELVGTDTARIVDRATALLDRPPRRRGA